MASRSARGGSAVTPVQGVRIRVRAALAVWQQTRQKFRRDPPLLRTCTWSRHWRSRPWAAAACCATGCAGTGGGGLTQSANRCLVDRYARSAWRLRMPWTITFGTGQPARAMAALRAGPPESPHRMHRHPPSHRSSSCGSYSKDPPTFTSQGFFNISVHRPVPLTCLLQRVHFANQPATRPACCPSRRGPWAGSR